MLNAKHYHTPHKDSRWKMSLWDLPIIFVVLSVLAAIFWGASTLSTPYKIGDSIPISLEPQNLFYYSIQSIFRMAIALGFSFFFTFTIGTLAAKNHRAERVIINLIDVLQSIPILGFQSISIMTFIYLFPGSMLGPQCAAIFAIFTSQVWNMILSFYQSLQTVPKDLKETAAIFQLNAWQKFWRIEVPFAMPNLLWNTMMSLSAGWFFVVAAEAISVSNQHITLPGIGSYIDLALTQENYRAIFYAILTMFFIILLYDQLIFRPLLAWSEKFQPDLDSNKDYEEPWFLSLLHHSTIATRLNQGLSIFKRSVINFRLHPFRNHRRLPKKLKIALDYTGTISWHLFTMSLIFGSLGFLAYYIHLYLTWGEALKVFGLGLITAVKVAVLIVLASIIWVPIGTYIGLNARLSRIMQPIVQFCAAFPADVVYPFLMMLILHYHLNVEIWSSPLMILGTQWYILFNVIAGVQALSPDLKLVAQNYGLKGWLWWKRLILPSIFPYYVTGAMTAAGGCWNASILADVIRWGDTTIQATGLGGYIDAVTRSGDFPRIALGIGIMCILVSIINRLVWHRLYEIIRIRYQMGQDHI